jgi:hypothetical protein
MSSSYHECAKKEPTCKGRGGGIKGYHACAKNKRCGKKFSKKEVGTKREVYEGVAQKTKQGLKKEDLVINAKGNVVKKKGSRRQPTPQPEPVEEKKEEPTPEPEPEPEEKKEPEPEPEPEEEKKEPKPKKEKKPRAKKKKDIEVDDELRDILEDFIQDSIEARDNMKIKYDEARDRLTYETGDRRKKYKEDAKFWKKRIKEQEKWLDVETDDEIRKWYKENTAHIESMRQRGRGKVIDAKCKKLFKDNNINTIKDFRKWALAHHPDKIQQRNPNMTEAEVSENNENYSIMNNCIEEYRGNLFKSQAREDRHAKRRSSRPQKKEERREPKTQGLLTYIKGGSLKLSQRTGTFFPGFSNPRLE